MRNGRVPSVGFPEYDTLRTLFWLGLKDTHSGVQEGACIGGILHPVPNRNEMECSGRRWGQPSGLSGRGLILYLAGLRPPPRYSHSSYMRLCTMLGILPRTHVLVSFMICIGSYGSAGRGAILCQRVIMP